jgi:3-hydroxyisobutyrate dehydrogenase-like beta-hydroxyacid dehydrogenase
MRTEPTVIAVIGMGAMGSSLAARLVRGGQNG